MNKSLLPVVPAIFWGLNFFLAQLMIESSSFVEAGLWRYVFGVGTLLLFTLRKMPRWQSFKHNLGLLSLIGFVGLFLFNYFFFLGMASTSPMNATVIMSLNPTLTLVLSFFILKTSVRRQEIAGVTIALLGAVYFISKGHPSELFSVHVSLGDGYIFVANILFALHHVWVKKIDTKLTNQQFTFVTNLICLLGFFFIIPFYGIGKISSYPADYWWSALGMGVLGTAIAYFIWNQAIAQLGAVKTGVYINLIPVAAALFAILFGDQLERYHLVGGAVIIVGVLVMQYRKGERGLKPEGG